MLFKKIKKTIENKRKSQLFIMMVGLPLSGRSQFVEELSEKKFCIVVSKEKIRSEMIMNGQLEKNDIYSKSSKKLVDKTTCDRIIEFLNKGYDVVYDSSNLVREHRVNLLNRIKNETNSKKLKNFVFYFSKSGNECLALSKKINDKEYTSIRSLYEKLCMSFELPLESEGWDDVYYFEYVED